MIPLGSSFVGIVFGLDFFFFFFFSPHIFLLCLSTFTHNSFLFIYEMFVHSLNLTSLNYYSVCVCGGGLLACERVYVCAYERVRVFECVSERVCVCGWVGGGCMCVCVCV